jgi:hypothetical protein
VDVGIKWLGLGACRCSVWPFRQIWGPIYGQRRYGAGREVRGALGKGCLGWGRKGLDVGSAAVGIYLHVSRCMLEWCLVLVWFTMLIPVIYRLNFAHYYLQGLKNGERKCKAGPHQPSAYNASYHNVIIGKRLSLRMDGADYNAIFGRL